MGICSVILCDGQSGEAKETWERHKKAKFVILTGPRDGVAIWHWGHMRNARVLVRWQKTGAMKELRPRSLKGKARQGKVNHVGLASLNNFCWL